MNLYRQLDDAYQRLSRRPRPAWLVELCAGDSDEIVATIRADQADPLASDRALRSLIRLGRREPDALTVAMYALAPKLRARLARTVTDDYRSDALTDLAFVLLDSPIDVPRLAARIVNRAHNRTHKATRGTHKRGRVNITTVEPQPPDTFTRRSQAQDEDVAATAARRVDLARFNAAVQQAIHRGHLDATAWRAYRDHRLRRALDVDAPVCSSHERITASRTARKLSPLIDAHLHAA